MNDFVYKNDDIGGEEEGDKARSARDAVHISHIRFFDRVVSACWEKR